MAKVIRKGKLNSKLAKLENAQKLALIESGMLVAQRATQKAPVDTGRLKRSLHPTVPQSVGYGKMITLVGTNVEYAAFQEFGTKYMQPHPYLNPALEESREDIKKLIAKGVVKALQ